MNANLRYWEYYGLQEKFDSLYQESGEGLTFNKLYELIISEENILLAYRTIKSNKGSKTVGVDFHTIEEFKQMNKDVFVSTIRKALNNYKPKAVKRVMIPKPNGKMRPLGIPSMIDRIIQQMIKQVIEPICEAKFFKHSYGFRPQRSTHHAIARCTYLINHFQVHYAVDIDIEGFFDNVNHTLLLKQLWNIGIRDRIVLKIISKMLKAPIKGIGIPTKGTPQGGILSPLLSNVVLNDLDQWVANQWEQFDTKFKYKYASDRYVAQKKTKLKIGFIIRYADDFKILTNSYNNANKWFHAVKQYLKHRLKLDISPDKSKIINLKKNKSQFLGFTIGSFPKKKKHLASSKMNKKKMDNIKKSAVQLILKLSNEPNTKNAMRYNSFVLGLHNYFKIGSHIYMDFARIGYDLRTTMMNRLKTNGSYGIPENPPPSYKKFYKNDFKTWRVAGVYLYPIADINTTIPINFNQLISPYTDKGRKYIHKNLKNHVKFEIQKLLYTFDESNTTEYLDNRISRYSMKDGKCEITNEFLCTSEVHCHHFLPKSLGGDDSFNNLRIVHKLVHILIHATNSETIDKYLKLIKPSSKQLTKINQYRLKCNLTEII
ncbi:group II intron reverse transcriptase/maturase [Bacillus sp. CRN 9]|nr:group II intron reverse transcriptase/maturase [Bacillus sp. CRN 9]